LTCEEAVVAWDGFWPCDHDRDGRPEQVEGAGLDRPGGFGSVTGDHQVTEPGTSEAMLTIVVPNADAVSASFDRAVGAGARPVTEPAEHDWGYTALVADPDEHLWTLFAADSVRRKPTDRS
jgi:hypothetical protein